MRYIGHSKLVLSLLLPSSPLSPLSIYRPSSLQNWKNSSIIRFLKKAKKRAIFTIVKRLWACVCMCVERERRGVYPIIFLFWRNKIEKRRQRFNFIFICISCWSEQIALGIVCVCERVCVYFCVCVWVHSKDPQILIERTFQTRCGSGRGRRRRVRRRGREARCTQNRPTTWRFWTPKLIVHQKEMRNLTHPMGNEAVHLIGMQITERNVSVCEWVNVCMCVSELMCACVSELICVSGCLREKMCEFVCVGLWNVCMCLCGSLKCVRVFVWVFEMCACVCVGLWN